MCQVARGRDSCADAVMLRVQPELFGLVASTPVVSRLVVRLAGEETQGAFHGRQ